jgi:hypothetical protein
MPGPLFILRNRVAALISVLLLAGCQAEPAVPPRIEETVLRQIARADILTLGFPDPIWKAAFSVPDQCSNVHGTIPALTLAAAHLEPWARLKLQYGIARGPGGWNLPDDRDKPVDRALDARLRAAARSVVLRLSATKETEHDQTIFEHPEATCATRYQLSAPSYSQDIAFVDRDFSCGALCGNGVTMALEYRNGGWHLIATRLSWIA